MLKYLKLYLLYFISSLFSMYGGVETNNGTEESYGRSTPIDSQYVSYTPVLIYEKSPMFTGYRQYWRKFTKSNSDAVVKLGDHSYNVIMDQRFDLPAGALWKIWFPREVSTENVTGISMDMTFVTEATNPNTDEQIQETSILYKSDLNRYQKTKSTTASKKFKTCVSIGTTKSQTTKVFTKKTQDVPKNKQKKPITKRPYLLQTIKNVPTQKVKKGTTKKKNLTFKTKGSTKVSFTERFDLIPDDIIPIIPSNETQDGCVELCVKSRIVCNEHKEAMGSFLVSVRRASFTVDSEHKAVGSKGGEFPLKHEEKNEQYIDDMVDMFDSLKDNESTTCSVDPDYDFAKVGYNYGDYEFACMGVVVHNYTVIVPAHCIDCRLLGSGEGAEYYVSSEDAVRYTVADVTFFPYTRGTGYHDLAIMKLDEQFLFRKYDTKHIKIAYTPPKDGTSCFIAYYDGDGRIAVQHANIKDEDCREIKQSVTSCHLLCATAKDNCVARLGTALICDDQLVGIVTSVDEQCATLSPIFTDVTAYKTWIIDNLPNRVTMMGWNSHVNNLILVSNLVLYLRNRFNIVI